MPKIPTSTAIVMPGHANAMNATTTPTIPRMSKSDEPSIRRLLILSCARAVPRDAGHVDAAVSVFYLRRAAGVANDHEPSRFRAFTTGSSRAKLVGIADPSQP